ncbi:MAG TPA: outer membrane beta-barrel protein [Sphingomicrobium sp.]|nr:outer membrane beta-barrel protein [Sphingomicrobium sp.]
MTRIKILVSASAIALGVTLAAAPAQAQEPEGWYIGAAATGSFLNAPRQTVANAPMPGSTLRATNNVDTGLGWQAEFGRAFHRFRIEAEIGRTENDPHSYTVTSPASLANTIPQTGEFAAMRYMANGYFDFLDGPVRPYIGAGAGIARVHVVTIAPRAPFPTEPPRTLIDDSGSHFAWQLMAGASLRVARRLALTAQYRWFDAGTIAGHDTRGQRFTEKMSGHNIDVGLRFTF